MPIVLTHDPRKVEVGNTIWLIRTSQSPKAAQNQETLQLGSQTLKPEPYRIIKITQTLSENNKEGTGGPRKRNYQYYLISENNPKNEIILANHTNKIFHSLEDLINWLRTEIKEWQKINKEHNERKEKLEGITFIQD